MVERLAGADRDLHFDDSLPAGSPNVWMFVGVNGVGKTTSIGKVAQQQIAAGRSVLLAAGDTFRAAAAEQLGTWAERSGAEFVRGADGGDPSSVIFDGVERAAARKIDLVLADTAGRLHTKTNLMEELRKVRRVAEKGAGTVTETLLVIDATTGQNGLAQAREFREATDVTGVVLTKLDGSAKGGIVFAIETELGIPIKLVGVGEQIGDLIPFVAGRVRLGPVRRRRVVQLTFPPTFDVPGTDPDQERPMGMMRHPSRLVPMAVIAVLALGACGSGDDDSTAETPPPATESSDDGMIAPRPIEMSGGGAAAGSANATRRGGDRRPLRWRPT